MMSGEITMNKDGINLIRSQMRIIRLDLYIDMSCGDLNKNKAFYFQLIDNIL